MKTKPSIILILCLILMVACVPATPGGSTSPTELIPPTGESATPVPTLAYTPTPAVPAPSVTHIPVDLSPAQRAAIQALSKQNSIPIDQIQLVSTQAMQWPSGCLGIVIPGVMCTQGPVVGFLIILSVNGRQYEYHTNQDGTSVISAAQQLALVRFVVSASDHSIQVVDPNIPLGPTYNPAFNGFLPSGESILGTAYVLDFTNQARAVAVDASGSHELSFIKNPNYGLAIWRGGLGTLPRLAWGTQPISPTLQSSLQVSAPDGSQLETLLTQDFSPSQPQQLVAELWSADGTSLYFSKEPYGIGGYILFAGASNLYRIDTATKQVTALIPLESPSGQGTCLDAISGDYRFVADHCSQKTITVRDLTSGSSTTIQPPAGLSGFHLLGSARFSPDGKRLAFALAKGNPNDEQGWVAVSQGTSGGSKLILTGQAGMYYTVAGWLDDQTLLVQTNSIQCNPTCDTGLWSVGADGSNPHKVADGSFLTVLDNQ